MVIGVMLSIFFLCWGVLYLMSQQARMTEHKIKRMRAYYAAMSGVAYAFDQLRQGINPSGSPALSIGSGIYGYPAGGLGVNIQVNSGAGVSGTDEVRITVNY